MLPRNQRMELLSRAYIQAVVAHAGCTSAMPSPDFGIDLNIHRISEIDGSLTDEGAALHLQLKSTTEAAYRADEDAFHYDLDIKAYNFLRKSKVLIPRFLVLFV